MDSKLDHEQRMTKALNRSSSFNRFAIVDEIFRDAFDSFDATNEIFSDTIKTAWTRYFGTQRNSRTTTDEIFCDPRFVRRNKRDISRRDTVRETQSDEKISRDAI